MGILLHFDSRLELGKVRLGEDWAVQCGRLQNSESSESDKVTGTQIRHIYFMDPFTFIQIELSLYFFQRFLALISDLGKMFM